MTLINRVKYHLAGEIIIFTASIPGFLRLLVYRQFELPARGTPLHVCEQQRPIARLKPTLIVINRERKFDSYKMTILSCASLFFDFLLLHSS